MEVYDAIILLQLDCDGDKRVLMLGQRCTSLIGQQVRTWLRERT